MAADLVATNTMMDHIGRYLPSVRMNGAAFSFVVDLIINYGSPVLHLVMVRASQFMFLLGQQPGRSCNAVRLWELCGGQQQRSRDLAAPSASGVAGVGKCSTCTQTCGGLTGTCRQ